MKTREKMQKNSQYGKSVPPELQYWAVFLERGIAGYVRARYREEALGLAVVFLSGLNFLPQPIQVEPIGTIQPSVNVGDA